VTVYLCIPEKDLLAKAGVIRLVLQTLISEMNDTYDNLAGETAEEKGCRPVLLLLDEAGTVGIHGLHHYAATVAGRGISIFAAIQDLAQLDGLYGEYFARTIRNNMDSKIFYRQADYDTALSIERALGSRSEYAHSQTLHNGQVASEGRVEQAVALLTAREITDLDPSDVIVFFSNRKFRARRMDWRSFPLLKQRHAMPPPPFSALPPVAEIPLPSLWEQQESRPHFPIDPDAFN
jgi:type IV secretory pathway TraG/TraD family ATPase VirD4